MEQINWGIIGCGDVTEVKSGPAFYKIPHSALVAVMRRDEEKVKDYARRHGVPACYTDAQLLIQDPAVNAVYVATPPSTHAAYTLAALQAGKPVYVEKPMSLHAAEAARMAEEAERLGVKLSVAHYRRAQPLFQYIKQLLESGTIGEVRSVKLALVKAALTAEELKKPQLAWRVNSAVSGGGLFHDLAPHQLDILYYFFGEAQIVEGLAINQAGHYDAPDNIVATIAFKNNVLFSGHWCFSLPHPQPQDSCEITGTLGTISFSFFEQRPVQVHRGNAVETISFDPLLHVQQPMIEKVCNYFRGWGENPCSAREGQLIMQWIESITNSRR